MLRFCIWLEAFYLRREGFRVKEMIFEYADMKYSIPSDMEKGVESGFSVRAGAGSSPTIS